MVFAQTEGIVSVLLDHTRTRGPSVARMRDLKKKLLHCIYKFFFVLQDNHRVSVVASSL